MPVRCATLACTRPVVRKQKDDHHHDDSAEGRPRPSEARSLTHRCTAYRLAHQGLLIIRLRDWRERRRVCHAAAPVIGFGFTDNAQVNFRCPSAATQTAIAGQRRSLDSASIQKRAITAAEIPGPPLAIGVKDLAMIPADTGVAQLEIAG